MEVDYFLAQSDPEEVNPTCAESTREPHHATTLGTVNRIYWVVQSGSGADLHGNEIQAIDSD